MAKVYKSTLFCVTKKLVIDLYLTPTSCQYRSLERIPLNVLNIEMYFLDSELMGFCNLKPKIVGF